MPTNVAEGVAKSPPLGYLFAAFLGYNPLKGLLGSSVLSHLRPSQAATITSRGFYPSLIGSSFVRALGIILIFAASMSVVAAIAFALRGQQYINEDEESVAQKAAIGATATVSPEQTQVREQVRERKHIVSKRNLYHHHSDIGSGNNRSR